MTNEPVNKYDDFDCFIAKCKHHVNAINKYKGSDPLSTWYNYLLWMEENFVIDFNKKTIFDEILATSLWHFEKDQRYKQDRRLIKMFIKYVSVHSKQ